MIDSKVKDVNEITYDLSLLRQSRDKWDRSPAIRLYYQSIFDALMQNAGDGSSLDIGSGIGTIKSFYPAVTTSDIEKTPYVDRAVSCYDLEALGEQWENLLATDVLHHLRRPFDFFRSAARVLKPGGRILLCEPAATTVGTLFYRLCHHEPMRPSKLAPPFVIGEKKDENEEFANMGMAIALFRNHRQWTEDTLAEMGLTVVSLQYRDFFAYPLTGGLSRPQLVSAGTLKRLLKLECLLPQIVLKFFSLRVIVVLQKEAL